MISSNGIVILLGSFELIVQLSCVTISHTALGEGGLFYRPGMTLFLDIISALPHNSLPLSDGV